MATIKDVARIAGVSVSTVSHVVNGTRYVSPEKVKKVEDAIRQLDELPNFIAKRSGAQQAAGSRSVLLLLSKKNSLFQNQVKEKLEEILEEKGYLPVSLAYDLDGDRLAAIRSLAGSLSLCGLIAFPDREGVLSKAFFKGLQLPVVLIGNPVDQFAADTLLPDTFEGGYRAVRHLIKNGHEKIAYLSESEERGAHRFEGYRKALEDARIPVENSLVWTGLHTEEQVSRAMGQLAAAEPAPTALVIADSLPLVPAIQYAVAHNIAVPRDLSIVSLNDPEWAPLMTPELTCVDKQPRQFALAAADLLFQRMARGEMADLPSPGHPYRTKTLPSLLNVRNSTCGIGRGPFGEKAENASVLALSGKEKEKLRQKQYTAAISFHYMGKAWMGLQEKGIKKIFDELGISIIAVTDAHFNAELQCKQLESIRFLKPDILISIPVDTKDTAAAFRAIADSDTRLVLITNVPEGLTPPGLHLLHLCKRAVPRGQHGPGAGGVHDTPRPEIRGPGLPRGAELFRHKAAGQRGGAGAHRGIPRDPGVREGQLPHGDRGLPKDVGAHPAVPGDPGVVRLLGRACPGGDEGPDGAGAHGHRHRHRGPGLCHRPAHGPGGDGKNDQRPVPLRAGGGHRPGGGQRASGESGPLVHRGGAHQRKPGQPAEKLEKHLQRGAPGGAERRGEAVTARPRRTE